MAGFLPTRITGGEDNSSTLELPQQFNPNTLETPQQFNPAARGYRMVTPHTPQAGFGTLPWKPGGVYYNLAQYESGNRNILSQIDEGSPQERSQGFFQIKTSTLQRYGRQAGVDPSMLTRAMDLPPEMQQRIVSQIPLREFGPRTQALMRQKYGMLDGRMTIGQIAKMFGEGTAYAAEPPPDASGLPAAGEPQERLRQILAGQGPERMYDPLGMEPPEALQAGEFYSPRAARAMEGIALGPTADIEGVAAAAREVPQLAGAARAMVRRARQFGVDPEDIGPLAQRVREGTLSVRGLSQALKNLRGDVPQTARTAAAIRQAYGKTNLPRDLLGEISKALRAGRISPQQAKQILKVGVPAAVVGLTAGKAQAADTGDGAPLPPPPGDLPGGPGVAATVPGATYLAGTSPQQAQKPVNMAKLGSLIAHLPADRQKRILDQAQGINKALDEGKPPVGPGDMRALPEQQRTDIADDIRHPWYGYLRRPGTAAVGKIGGALWPRFGPETPEYRHQVESTLGHMFFPQTPTQAALMAATAPMGWAETAPELAPEVAQGLRGWGAARQALRPLVNTWPKRVLGMGAVGAGASAATGEGPWRGFKTGVEFQAPAEALGAVLGGVGRLGGRGHLLNQTERDASEAIGSVLPPRPGPRPGTAKPFDLHDWKTPAKAFDDVQEALRPNRDWVHGQMRGQKFEMPIVKGGNPDNWHTFRVVQGPKGPVAVPNMVDLAEAEKQLDKMGDIAWASSTGKPKQVGRARDIREMQAKYKQYVAGKMPLNVRRVWSQVRHQSGAASAIRRLIEGEKVGYEALDPNTGEINQPRLAEGINNHMADLRRQLGPEATDRLWRAVTRLNPRGPLYRAFPHRGAWKDEPGHWLPRIHWYPGEVLPSVSILPETYKPVGNVPIWMYPPRAPLAAATGQYVQQKIGNQPQPPPQGR